MVTAGVLPFRENSHGRAGNRTRDLIISGQILWPLDHEVGLYSYCMFMYFHRASWHSSATLTEGFPCFFLSCKANTRVKPAKTGHGPHTSKIFVLFYVLFCVVLLLFMCICALYYRHQVATQLQLNIYHISYYITSYIISHHIISYIISHIISYHISYHIYIILYHIYHIVSYHIISYIISYHIILYIISYHILYIV
jgi:hypothetical protein